MALALYRKYRPRTFAEVIGQEHVTEPLSQALRSGRLHHAYLFSGPRGCGKTSSARILARSLNCEQGPTPEPCGTCASCRSLANDGAGSIDVIEIDAASHGGVDDARDLREKAFFAPASSRYKIYVIDEAHMVSSAGFNALLKLVEEPPDYVKFIFATTEPEKVLGTIRSRTHHYPFRLIPPAVLRPYLQQLTDAEGVDVDPAVFPLVVRAGGGSARDTLSVLDQLIAGAGPEGVSYARAVTLLGVTDVALIDEMCDALAAGDGAAAYQTIDRVAEAGHDARRFASDLLERLRDLIVLQQVPDAVTKGLIDGPADQLEQMNAQATRLGPATLSRCADIVHNGLVEMRGTTAPRLLLELITARMLLPGADDSSGALLQRLERMERRLTLGAEEVRSHPDAPATGGGGGGISAAPATGGGGGISAARAAAAAAGRRAPAPSGPASATPVSATSGSPAGFAGPGSAATVEAEVPGEPDPRVPGSSAASSAAPVSAAPVSGAAATDPGFPASAGSAAAAAGSAAPDPTSPSSAVFDPSAAGQSAEVGSSPVMSRPVLEPAGQDAAGVPPSSPASTGASAPAEPVPARRQPEPPARQPEPAGVMPDAPEEPGAAIDAGVPGQLSAASIREVWPEIMVAVGRKSKKIAALAQGATVRDLEGQTVVLTFRFPAHAKMVAAEPTLISDALYEALGGRWQIRCDVAGESGPSPGSGPAPRGPQGPGGPAQGPPGPAQRGPQGPAAGRAEDSILDRGAQARNGGGTARQRDAVSPPSAAANDDDGDGWPEPARPGGPATAAGSRGGASTPADAEDADSDDWPEPARPGGMAPSGGRTAADGRPGAGTAGRTSGDPGAGQSHGAGQGFGSSGAGQGLGSPGAGQGFGSPEAGQGFAGPGGGQGFDGSGGFDSSADGQTLGAPGFVGPGRAVGVGGPGDANGSGGVAGNAGPQSPGPDTGHAGVTSAAGRSDHIGRGEPAAQGRQAAVATGAPPNEGRPGPRNDPPAAGTGSAMAAPGQATGRPASSGLAAARAAAAGAGRAGAAATANKNSAWADGSPTEEAPYDPEYDGPVKPRAGAPGSAFEGFDPGDEPLDDVIDEKTARQSSEQQAVQLLRDALGAEKISES